MKTAIKYIELKSGFGHSGPAWIGLVSFSKSGRTIYFDGKAFQSLDGNGISSNFYDLENGDEYWISGAKKDQTDRHQFGSGKIQVEDRIIEEYLTFVNKKKLDLKRFELCTIDQVVPIDRIHEFENQVIENDSVINENIRFKKPNELTEIELDYFIQYYEANSIEGMYLKGRKFSRKLMNELIAERERRQNNN